MPQIFSYLEKATTDLVDLVITLIIKLTRAGMPHVLGHYPCRDPPHVRNEAFYCAACEGRERLWEWWWV